MACFLVGFLVTFFGPAFLVAAFLTFGVADFLLFYFLGVVAAAGEAVTGATGVTAATGAVVGSTFFLVVVFWTFF